MRVRKIPYIFSIYFLLICHNIPNANCWSASTTFIAAPPSHYSSVSSAASSSASYQYDGILAAEVCGKCRIRVGNRTTELFSFKDGPNWRFLFICPQSGQLRLLDKVEMAIEEGKGKGVNTQQKKNTIGSPKSANLQKTLPNQPEGKNGSKKVCRIVRWQKWPACNLQKVRPIPKAGLYRAKYGRARTNIAQMGFVPTKPDLWLPQSAEVKQPQETNNSKSNSTMFAQHKWWWYFALRLNRTDCRLAKLPTGAAHIVLDLGVHLVENAYPLYTCPLVDENERKTQQLEKFGCSDPHIFVSLAENGVPLELDFTYEMVPDGGELRMNPPEREYAKKRKAVRILLGQTFGGKRTFMEFAPYCDYSNSFAQIQPFIHGDNSGSWANPQMSQLDAGQNGEQQSHDGGVEGMAAISQLQQSLSTIRNGLKSAKGALKMVTEAIGQFGGRLF